MSEAKTELPKVTERKRQMREVGYRLFSEKGIETVSMQEIADRCDVAKCNMYRYYPSKLDLAVAISADAWRKFTVQNYEHTDQEQLTAAQRYEYWLESMLDLFRNHKDLLRFNQFFNVYVANEQVSEVQMKPFNDVIRTLAERFHKAYELGKQDGTLKTEIPEEMIFSTTLHLMLAATTRYAVGLVYESREPEKELAELKKMLMQRYTCA